MTDRKEDPPSNSSASESSDESDWLDAEPDEESSTCVSLFDSQTFSSPSEMLAHCKEHDKFDFLAVVRKLQVDFYGAIKLVNFIRGQVKQDKALPEQITIEHIADDELLKPVLDNDTLLFSLDEIIEAAGDGASGPSDDATKQLLAHNKALEDELEVIRTQFESYRLTVEQTLDRRWGDDTDPGPSKVTEKKKDTSDYYFESYAAHEIHETMLKDAVRTDAYRDYIYDNKHLFKDKVVLDIGCGTGILSMFCAKAGAKKVIAVDKSDIMTKAMENIFNNGLSDIITCVKGAIEDVVLPVDKVDVIVSEWMGYFLLYEAMLPSVLYARDKYLKPDGIMAPSTATMWIAPVADPEFVSDHISYWRDVYGFDMKAMQEGIYDEARIEIMPKDSVCGKPYPFKQLDLRTVKKEELFFKAKWESSLDRDIDMLDGFLIWFDNHFSTTPDEAMPEPETTTEEWTKKKLGNVGLSTGPFTTPTHWKQGFLLTPPDDTGKDLTASTKLSGEVEYAVLEENARALTVGMKWTVADKKQMSRTWKMK